MAVKNASDKTKTVADPNAEFETMQPLWNRSRAICSGERYAKDLDGMVSMNNMLIPFSPSMTQAQYDFYKAEAELPGIVSQFAKMLVGGLLRKTPILTLPDDSPEEAKDWIIDDFAQDDSSLVAFLDSVLWEEMQTSRSWIYVDYPSVSDAQKYTKKEMQEFKPYPVIWSAETIINWSTTTNAQGRSVLSRVIVKGMVEEFTENEFHPNFRDTVYVHELDEAGWYQIRIFQRADDNTDVPVVSGDKYNDPTKNSKVRYDLTDTITNIMANGERLRAIPAWPTNGNVGLQEPILSPLIDKEVALYNKISRRNHLLYGAATYTPVLQSDMPDEDFDEIVQKGLGSWIKIGENDKLDVLKTPTDALKDMETAIINAITEMAKMGIRMLTPETAQSGVALEIRNAAQTAQLGTLNVKISQTMASIICFMINWRYGTEYAPSDIDFELSADFNPLPMGADWLRLATEWYQEGLIPRSIWLQLLKQNDMIEADYDDEEGQKELNDDEIINNDDNPELTKDLEEMP